MQRARQVLPAGCGDLASKCKGADKIAIVEKPHLTSFIISAHYCCNIRSRGLQKLFFLIYKMCEFIRKKETKDFCFHCKSVFDFF
jgi:hypothetical protein